jgi:hypothetical protein
MRRLARRGGAWQALSTAAVSRGLELDKSELAKVERYLRQTFANHSIRVVARPKKDDLAEVYIGEEFVATLSLDDEDGDRSYVLTMSILDTDLEA